MDSRITGVSDCRRLLTTIDDYERLFVRYTKYAYPQLAIEFPPNPNPTNALNTGVALDDCQRLVIDRRAPVTDSPVRLMRPQPVRFSPNCGRVLWPYLACPSLSGPNTQPTLPTESETVTTLKEGQWAF